MLYDVQLRERDSTNSYLAEQTEQDRKALQIELSTAHIINQFERAAARALKQRSLSKLRRIEKW